MNQLIPISIDGIKLIQLSQLSMEQSNELRNILPADSIKKMLYQGLELNDCILFEIYEYWLRNQQFTLRIEETVYDF
ncbi:hypothetical protein [Anditalea andensis]|uniref:Uncharacterized protein n=1 Tax=Anditalea andensis TaxID=1048983 RepID=A0A074KTH4_9BACT|nr:hypothetical protein [Anditalea andensis]KEO72189.1 hypothetical protein EL17_19995 [Anditalea andensis]